MKYGFLVILCFLLATLLVIPASANIFVYQGENIYWGDKVNLAGVFGWDCTVAWWAGDVDTSLIPPDKIHYLCDTGENVLITKEDYPAGDWYKWSAGKMGKHGNDLAFTVVGGPRPTETINITANITANVTSVPTTVPTTMVTPTPKIVYITVTVTPTPTPVPEPTPADFVGPKLPPIPVIILILIILGLVAYWWLQGTI